MIIQAYHGTDYGIAEKILNEGFLFKKNKEHWLGNGIYLFPDYSLAKWWTTQPSTQFGSKISNPAIVSCDIEIEEEKILNLLSLEDYKQFSELFEKSFLPTYKEYNPHKVPLWKQLRCTYCDFLKKTYELDAIIGNFNKPDQPYLPPKHKNVFDKFLLQYTEVQICVFNSKIIKNKKIERV